MKNLHRLLPRMGRLRVAAFLFLLLTAALSGRTAHAQTTRVVDDDGQGLPGNCDASQSAYITIGDAVNAASPGDTVFVCPGTYDEQVAITMSNLTLKGSGSALTILRPSSASVNSSGALTPFPVAAIITVNGATGVNVGDLAVDGSLADSGAGNARCLTVGYFAGIHFRNSSGSVASTHISHINSASVCTAGLSISSGFGSQGEVTINGNLIDDYGNIGLNCSGPSALCQVTGNTMRGAGPIDDEIQAGVIFRLGAGGEISGNTISDHDYTPAVGIKEFSVGVALFDAEPNLNPHLRQNNVFSGNQLDVQRQGTAQVFE